MKPLPYWTVIDRELRRPGVTRALLWEEYRAQSPDGFGHAWFGEHFDAWKGRVRPTSHQRCAFSATCRTHVGVEKIFVDFAGDRIEMGMITPPVGRNVCVVKGVARDVPMATIFRGVMPFLLAMALCLLLLFLFPQIALVSRCP